MHVRVVTWNMNHSFRRSQAEAQWAYLASLDPTLALVQEAPATGAPQNAILREVAGRGLYTGIVGFGPVTMTEVPMVRLGEKVPPDHLESSHPGSFVVARVNVDGRELIAVSIYGLMRSAYTKVVYATTAVQRMLSDLTPILDVNRSKAALVMGGDLNVTPQIPKPDTDAHIALINRIKAFGLSDCLGSVNEGFVRTHRHRNDPNSVAYQNDWMFASKRLAAGSCVAKDCDDAWNLSDHCPVVADFELFA